MACGGYDESVLLRFLAKRPKSFVLGGPLFNGMKWGRELQ
jgi:hypothetical protein